MKPPTLPIKQVTGKAKECAKVPSSKIRHKNFIEIINIYDDVVK